MFNLAIESVFVCSVKLCVFHGVLMFVVASMCGFEYRYIMALLCAITALVPLVPLAPVVLSTPMVLRLVLADGHYVFGAALLGVMLLDWWFVLPGTPPEAMVGATAPSHARR